MIWLSLVSDFTVISYRLDLCYLESRTGILTFVYWKYRSRSSNIDLRKKNEIGLDVDVLWDTHRSISKSRRIR